MSRKAATRYLTERQRALISARRERKPLHIQRCAMQAKVAKAMRIINLKGKNGMSMSAELLAQHGIDGPMKAKLLNEGGAP